MSARALVLAAFVAAFVLVVSACGRSSQKLYSATNTAACLRHRPEAHKLSPEVAPLGIGILELHVRAASPSDGSIWANKNRHVPALIMNFFPPKADEPPDFAKASFFTDQGAASAYYRSALDAARSAYPSPTWDLSRFVDQRRNVVIEWNTETQSEYERIVFACLTT
jgi:hypothetical protein